MIVSPKMSSLAFDEVQEQMLERNANFIPDLQIVKPRYVLKNDEFSHSEEIQITGIFSVSF